MGSTCYPCNVVEELGKEVRISSLSKECLGSGMARSGEEAEKEEGVLQAEGRVAHHRFLESGKNFDKAETPCVGGNGQARLGHPQRPHHTTSHEPWQRSV